MEKLNNEVSHYMSPENIKHVIKSVISPSDSTDSETEENVVVNSVGSKRPKGFIFINLYCEDMHYKYFNCYLFREFLHLHSSK